MKIINKLNLSLGLLLSIGSISIVANTNRNIVTQENCDAIIHSLFTEVCFNQTDSTPFYEIITEIIELFKVKRNNLSGDLLIRCDEMITLLEKNKYNSNLQEWIKIFITPNLLNLLPEETAQYINDIPSFTKIKTLISKLK